MDSQSIELRLRLAAPEEPAVLPPLVLPAFDRFGRAVPNVRMRRAVASPRGNRLVYALVALVLLMLSVIVAGALRIIDNPFDTKPFERAGLGCTEVVEFENHCFTMTWPEGWHELAAGSFSRGDFTQADIAYERVALVVASVPLPACAAPGGPGSTPYELLGVNYLPRETADTGLACLRAAELPEGAVRISAEVGNRSRGVIATNGPSIQDASEPSADAGWTQLVDGRPARLTIETSTTASGTTVETRTWDILFPSSIDRILRVRADIAGPDLEKGRTAVGSVLAGLRFEAEQVPLDEATKRNVLRSRLDDLDRQARQGGFDFYGCFPREVGARAGTISTGPGSRLPAPVEVTCGTAIEASAAGLWRITLETTWPAGPGYPAGGRIDELFVTGDGRAAGSFEWTLDGSPPPLEGEQAMLPMAPRVLPPLLTGPLNLPVGSIVEMLYPGMYPSVVVDPSSEDLSPYVVGWHFHVVSGPRMAGGDEWYEVQSPDHGLTETTWARGTFQGRPMLALVQPACPSEPIDLDQLAGLLAYEQFACLRGREVTLETVIATDAPPKEPVICLSQESLPTSCPETVASPAWLVGDAQMLVFGPAGPNGVAPAFQVWLDPSVDSLPAGVWLRVHGHVDDAAAADCTSTTSDPMMVTLPRPEMQVLVCRERFVITGFERVSAP